ncbi:hypothetical protein ACN27F_17115 [Solwaraspora sp. WMMB335]|uniref:hypothetical protein n=1 Tax=Solwaraspora sp. WMMB335 TaxID=3404118 RepID=UPI003B9665A2
MNLFSIRRRGWGGTVLVLIALVLGLTATTVTAVPAPARAAATQQICVPILDAGGQIIGWHCFDIPVAVDDCVPCPVLAVSFQHLVLPPEAEYRFVDELFTGVELLAEAALTTSPRVAVRLRAQAEQSFLAAAGALGGSPIAPGPVGTADLDRGVIGPPSQPWLTAAATDLVDGLLILQEAGPEPTPWEPDPQPWLTAAMEQFDEAYQELAERRPIGH